MKALSKNLNQISESPLTGFDALVKKMNLEGANIIALNVGQPDYEEPKSMREAIKNSSMMKGCNFYTPVPGTTEVRMALIKYHNEMFRTSYETDDIVFTNGAKEAVALAISAVIGPGDEAILIAPYWSTYKELVRFFGGLAIEVDSRNDNHVDFERLKAAVNSKTKAIIINSPNNPSGAVYSKKELELLMGIACEKDLYIISDEIYNTIVYNSTYDSCASIAGSEKRIVVINGFSKSASATGFRLGYAVSRNKEIIKGMIKIKSNFSGNVNSLFQKAMCEMIENGFSNLKTEIGAMKEDFGKRRNFISDQLRRLGYEHERPEGSFYIWCKIPSMYHMNSLDFSHMMLKKGVAVTPGIFFGKSYDGYVRISFASSMENLNEAIKRMEMAANQ